MESIGALSEDQDSPPSWFYQQPGRTSLQSTASFLGLSIHLEFHTLQALASLLLTLRESAFDHALSSAIS